MEFTTTDNRCVLTIGDHQVELDTTVPCPPEP